MILCPCCYTECLCLCFICLRRARNSCAKIRKMECRQTRQSACRMQRHSGHESSGPKGHCIKRMLSNSYLKLLAIRRTLKGSKLKSPWSSRRLGLSGPSLTVAAAPHIIAGTRPKWARASAGTRPKWARACIFSNLSQFCFSNSHQGGGRDARKAFAARAPNNARMRGTRNSRNF